MQKRNRTILIAVVAAAAVVGAAATAVLVATLGGGAPGGMSPDQHAAAMQGCRLSIQTPFGLDEGGKAVGSRPGSDGPDVHGQWGWFDDDGNDLSVTQPGYKPESYMTDRWVPYSEIHGYTCDGGATWTWLTK